MQRWFLPDLAPFTHDNASIRRGVDRFVRICDRFVGQPAHHATHDPIEVGVPQLGEQRPPSHSIRR